MKIFSKNSVIYIIVISTIFGVGSGFVGGLVARQFLPGFETDLALVDTISSINANRSGFSFKDSRKITIEQNDRVADVINTSKMSQIGIFKKIVIKSPNQIDGKAFNLYQHYIIDQPIATGLIFTSDGWLISTFLPDKIENYVAITKDRKIYNIDQAIPDSDSAYKFLHIDAYDLPVIKFSSENDIKNGQTVIATNWHEQGWLSSIFDKKVPDNLVNSSDFILTKIKLTESLPKDFFGSILLSLNGDVIGLIDSTGNIEPITRFQSVVTNFLKNKIISRPFFGVNYINYSKLVEVSLNKTERIKGAVLYQDNNVQAVIKNSPAEKAGLQAGDVITTVDNIEIGAENDLANVIQNYAPGEVVNIQYLREGELNEVDIALGSK